MNLLHSTLAITLKLFYLHFILAVTTSCSSSRAENIPKTMKRIVTFYQLHSSQLNEIISCTESLPWLSTFLFQSIFYAPNCYIFCIKWSFSSLFFCLLSMKTLKFPLLQISCHYKKNFFFHILF